MSAKVSSDALVRLNVNLNKETAAALKELAESQGISLTEAVRRSIALLKFVDEERAKGRKIQTMDPEGKNKRELVLM
ncbi:ribbon-helix-helix protein, CopG family [Arthrobacter crystallopoietes]|uniref:ribbon-helix-helix protein, CopG family n=1 Tax=Crystallibacter crystallopoietes TaxID=37928 RepID=UPI0011111A64|nr:ribbon-helix-helix protein, CopG family [Arthrobacter crystallopoietes]